MARAHHVSILILLDVVLEARWGSSQAQPGLSFNPYSVGCCSGSSKQEAQISAHCMFQSLFCWMLFWKSKWTGCVSRLLSCFNPYSVGCCSGSLPINRLTTRGATVSILILLDVVLEAYTLHSYAVADIGFNPYSVGCCSGS